MNILGSKRSQRFTLVELLVVLVIISIVLGLTVPAFKRLFSGSSVDIAARMVSSQMKLARAEAVSSRRYVAVIMPASGINVESGDDQIYNRQAFRSAYVTQGANNNEFEFEEWVAGTEWTFLPTGALIATVETSNFTALEANSDFDSAQPVDANDNPRYVPDDDWNVQDGAGIAEVDGSNTSNGILAGGAANAAVRAVVFKPNGRAALKSYITVMEGACIENNGNIERMNKANIRVMEVTPYSGLVRFIY